MLWIWLACSTSQPQATISKNEGPLKVWSLSYPVHYLASQIGGEHIDLQVLLPAGEDAATWRPSPEQIAELVRADIVFANGAQFEGWVKTASLPTGVLVDAAVQFPSIELEGQTHSHGKDGEHSHAGLDPHVWSDPDIYRLQAERVRDTLIQRDAENSVAYRASFDLLATELDTLISETLPLTEKLKGRPLAANHPAYNYFAHRFNLEIKSFDFSALDTPTESIISESVLWAESNPNAVMLWEAEPSTAMTDALKGYVHVSFDNLEGPNDGDNFDYPSQYRANLRVLEQLVSPTTEVSNAP